MNIEDWFPDNFESKLRGRYLNLDHLRPLYEIYNKEFNISKLGVSELGEEISLVEIGSGPFKVFAWSQMHGNESTTTKALFDFFKFEIIFSLEYFIWTSNNMIRLKSLK